MKQFKRILSILAIIVFIPLIVALFIKKDYAVEKAIIINKPKQEVFNYVKFLRNQDNFGKWNTMDSYMKKTYRGTDGTIGFVSAWESEDDDIGTGEQEIKKITEGERIDFELRFFKPFKATEPAFMATETVSENQTRVVWGFSGHVKYPLNLSMLFMDIEDMIGNDLQSGLLKLKTILEK